MPQSENALSPERWESFTEAEVTAIQSALALTIDTIIEAKNASTISDMEADAAACNLLVSGRIMYGISDHLGEPRPSLLSLETVAQSIANRVQDRSGLLDAA